MKIFLLLIVFVIILNIYAKRIERKKYNSLTNMQKLVYQAELNNKQNNDIIWIMLAEPIAYLLGILLLYLFLTGNL